QEMKILENRLFIFTSFQSERKSSIRQMGLQPIADFHFRTRIFFGSLCPPSRRISSLLYRLEVLKNQFCLHGFDVPDRINVSLDMNDVFIAEATNDMGDRVH